MDNKKFPLVLCYKGKIRGYSRQDFLKDLDKLHEKMGEHFNKAPHNAQWNEICFARCLKGLKGLPAIAEIQPILNELALKISASDAQFGAQEIGSALYGLQNMDCTTAAVQTLLQALTTKITASNAQLDAQTIGNALYGLQNMDGTTATMQALLQALTIKITASNALLDAQHIGNALYGLQNMDCTTEAVQALLQALTIKLTASNAQLDAQVIGNALYGLQNMDCTTAAMQALLQALSLKIKSSGLQLKIGYQQDRLAWSMTCAAYLTLNKKNPNMRHSLDYLPYLLLQHESKQEALSTNELTVLWLDALKKEHFNANTRTLNLHGLDYLSANHLLNEGFQYPNSQFDEIIFGKSSHSKTANRGRMQQLVSNCLKAHQVQDDFVANDSAFYRKGMAQEMKHEEKPVHLLQHNTPDLSPRYAPKATPDILKEKINCCDYFCHFLEIVQNTIDNRRLNAQHFVAFFRQWAKLWSTACREVMANDELQPQWQEEIDLMAQHLKTPEGTYSKLLQRCQRQRDGFFSTSELKDIHAARAILSDNLVHTL